jgi:hypothetical protein
VVQFYRYTQKSLIIVAQDTETEINNWQLQIWRKKLGSIFQCCRLALNSRIDGDVVGKDTEAGQQSLKGKVTIRNELIDQANTLRQLLGATTPSIA